MVVGERTPHREVAWVESYANPEKLRRPHTAGEPQAHTASFLRYPGRQHSIEVLWPFTDREED